MICLYYLCGKGGGCAVPEADVDVTSTIEEVIQTGWGSLTMEKVEKALLSLTLLVACLVVARLLVTIVQRLLDRSRLDVRVKHFVRRGFRIVLYVLTGLVFAGSLGIDVSSLIALASVLGLAVSLAMQEILSNVASGIELMLAKPFAPGDYISAGDAEGEVTEVTLTHTRLDTLSGQWIMLPNSALTAGKIINYSVRKMRRIEHALSVDYSCDPERVKASCLKAVSRTACVLSTPAPQAVIAAFGESAVEYHVRFWVEPSRFWDVNFTSLDEISRAFHEDGVILTYNHLNVHIVDHSE